MKNSSLDRLAVYIDYQNAYRGARQAFGSESDHHTVGQFDPMRVAKAIAQRKPNYPGAKLRTLVGVRIYRGLPGSTRDPRGYAAARKQTASWRGAIGPNGLRADIRLRPIAYGAGGPREKGIDVQLALDLAFAASDGLFDVVVLFSGDSDLLPALERASRSGVACEAAVWVGGGRRLPRKDYVKWEHRLDDRDYGQLQDPFDYTRS